MKHTKLEKAMRIALAGVLAGTMAAVSVPASAATNTNGFSDVAKISDGLAATDMIYPITGTDASFDLGAGAGAWYLKENLNTQLVNADNCDFYQYSITNDSDAPATLSIGYIATAYGANIFISAGKTYYLRNSGAASWTSGITEGDNATITIPAHFNGALRIPFAAYDIAKEASEAAPVISWGANFEYSFRTSAAKSIIFLVSAGNAGTHFAINGLSVVSMGNTNDYAAEMLYTGTLGHDANSTPGANIEFSFDEGTNSKDADFVQVKVCNYAPGALELFYIKLLGSQVDGHSNGYTIELQPTGNYQLYDFSTNAWTDAIINASPSYAPGAKSSITIPAGFDGLLRIPMSAFRAQGGSSDWVIDSNYITGLQTYLLYPNVTWTGNPKLGNLSWIDSGKAYAADGDVNGDGAVTVTDLIRAKKVITGDSGITFRATGLDNGDGAFDATDLVALRKALLLG